MHEADQLLPLLITAAHCSLLRMQGRVSCLAILLVAGLTADQKLLVQLLVVLNGAPNLHSNRRQQRNGIMNSVLYVTCSANCT